jgi:hypothetical protein
MNGYHSTMISSSRSSAPEVPLGHGLRDYLGLPIALAALIGMATWSWGRLVEVQIDFGRELYLAWQLTTGKQLYTDVIYYYGPLSPYLNALVFRLLGVSIQSLMLGNLVIAGLIIVVLYLLLLDVADAFSATFACLVFALVLPCSSYFVHPAIFNYICPYSHPVTHGMLLGLVSVLLAGRVNRSPTPGRAALCGLFIGLTFLTKPEVFVGAAAAVLVGLCLNAWQQRLPRWRTLALLTAWLGAAASVILTAYLALCLVIPSSNALLGVLGSWPHMRNQRATLFNQWVMGTDDTRGNLTALLKVLPWYGVMLLPLALYVPSRKSRIALFAAGAVSLAAAAVCGRPNLMLDGLRPLPVLIGALAIGIGWWSIRSRDRAGAQATTRKLMLTVFAALLLSRIMLQSTLLRYGFVLAAPASLVLIVACLSWLPAWLNAKTNRLLHTGSVVMVVLTFVVVSLARFQTVYRERTTTMGSGADSFVSDPSCEFAAPALAEIRLRVRPGQTLCVLPEGIMINYLARVESAVPYDCFIPPSLQMFDEHKIIAKFQARPPDYVLLVHRLTPEYGAKLFGIDYGRELYSWVTERYSPVSEGGKDPMTDDGDGFILLAAAGTVEHPMPRPLPDDSGLDQ